MRKITEEATIKEIKQMKREEVLHELRHLLTPDVFPDVKADMSTDHLRVVIVDHLIRDER